MTPDSFMHRCIELAKLGSGYVAPNPMVGAILVHNHRIIGEGWHQQFGGGHAEVNCINAVKEEDRGLISQSTLYVSLEPCSHFGKTPPCTDLIIKNKIPKLIIGCRDPNKEVKGFEKLKSAGVDVEMSGLEKECEELNKRFFTFHRQHRPYIILKWAQTADGFIAPLNLPKGETYGNSLEKRLFVSNEYSNRLIHKWRSEEASILIGTHTALLDDPELTNRYWEGPSPIRLVIDMNLKLPSSLKIFNQSVSTIIFNTKKHSEETEWSDPSLPIAIGTARACSYKSGAGERSHYYRVTHDVNLAHQVINALYQLKIQSVLVEGGARLLQSFIDENLWDEARIITNSELRIGDGLAAPLLFNAIKIQEYLISTDKVEIYKPKDSDS